MALDPTAREANFRDSMKKYLVDSLVTASGIYLSFDKSLATPKIQGHTVNRWVSVRFGTLSRQVVSDAIVELRCCTREDNEGFKLAQLTDTVMGYLTPDPSTTPDGIKRITFYRSYASPTPWTNIGGLIVFDIIESPEMDAEDETKYKVLTARIRFVSKI